ncbi:methionine aminotransferase [Alcaligenes sp. DN25]|uniref:methionine aminotransferase n=1 Tax=Alcaligenes TaxID=507 RepID=UPI00202DE44F|nr:MULTISPECIES: methionine aminotransferase [Alcaligenes]URW82758.1 methionine aminotransferase [Alcaligenes sp. DN25]WEA67585.1 methionine aminotransferase [Alcaligenes faecalis]
MQITSKLPSVGTTIFTTMSQLALEHKAINLGQGFPDFNPDPALIEAVHQAMLDGINQYPVMAGYPALRAAIASKTQARYGRLYNVDTEITVTSGATEALMASFQAFVHTGDEVVVIEPFYDLYIPAIELAGGTPVAVPMTAPSEAVPYYRVDWDRVEQAITSKTRMLVINFPHNPTCTILQPKDLDALEQIVEKHPSLIILSDEVYEHLTFDQKEHLSLATRPLLAERAVIVSSFGKTFHATGWKVGYCCAPASLSTEIRKVHQYTVFTVPSPLQAGLATYMQDPATWESLAAFYQEKRDHLHQGLQNTRFSPMPSEGTFFLLASYEHISELSELDFAKHLNQNYGVGAIPVSAFYLNPNSEQANHRLLRFCFAKQLNTLDQAIERLKKV